MDDYPRSLVTVTRYGKYQVAKIITFQSRDDDTGAVEYWIAPYSDPFPDAEWFMFTLDD